MREQLDNGLTLLWLPAAEASVRVLVSVDSGSHDEPQQLPGLAHLVEHLVFAGRRRDPDGRHWLRSVADCGGRWNASTQAEYTEYHLQVPASALMTQLARWLPRIWRLAPTSAVVVRERAVLQAEFLTRLGDPALHRQQLIAAQLPLAHPLSRFSAGHAASLAGDEHKLAQAAKAFHHAGYGAANVQVAIAGMVDEASQRAIAALLSRWPVGPSRRRLPVPPAPAPALPDLFWRGPRSDTDIWLLATLESVSATQRRAWPAWRAAMLDCSATGLLGQLRRAGLTASLQVQGQFLSGGQLWLQCQLDALGAPAEQRRLVQQWFARRHQLAPQQPMTEGDPEGAPGPPDPQLARMRAALREAITCAESEPAGWDQLGQRLSGVHWSLLADGGSAATHYTRETRTPYIADAVAVASTVSEPLVIETPTPAEHVLCWQWRFIAAAPALLEALEAVMRWQAWQAGAELVIDKQPDGWQMRLQVASPDQVDLVLSWRTARITATGLLTLQRCRARRAQQTPPGPQLLQQVQRWLAAGAVGAAPAAVTLKVESWQVPPEWQGRAERWQAQLSGQWSVPDDWPPALSPPLAPAPGGSPQPVPTQMPGHAALLWIPVPLSGEAAERWARGLYPSIYTALRGSPEPVYWVDCRAAEHTAGQAGLLVWAQSPTEGGLALLQRLEAAIAAAWAEAADVGGPLPRPTASASRRWHTVPSVATKIPCNPDES